VFRALVRGALFRRVELAARDDVHGLAALGDVDDEGRPWDVDRWADALEPYWQDHDEMLTGAAARGPALFQVTPGATTWRVRQLIDDPAGDHDWRIDAVVDLAASDEAGEVRLVVEAVGAL